MGFEIKNATWFSPLGAPTVGIVRILNDDGEEKYYLGIGRGVSESNDARMIAKQGARVYPSSLRRFLGNE